jgi:hypothetical protein
LSGVTQHRLRLLLFAKVGINAALAKLIGFFAQYLVEPFWVSNFWQDIAYTLIIFFYVYTQKDIFFSKKNESIIYKNKNQTCNAAGIIIIFCTALVRRSM